MRVWRRVAEKHTHAGDREAKRSRRAPDEKIFEGHKSDEMDARPSYFMQRVTRVSVFLRCVSGAVQAGSIAEGPWRNTCENSFKERTNVSGAVMRSWRRHAYFA